jgi:hypothetical protein
MTTLSNLMGAGVPPLQAQMTVGKVTTGLTGGGTSSQANATAIPSDVTVFSTVALNSGARLPATGPTSGQAGDIYVVANFGANPLLVYPATGGNISNAGVNTAVSIPFNKTADFYCLGANLWAASIGT